MHPNAKNLTGLTFGRWTAIEPIAGTNPIHWRCRCVCGSEKIVDGAHLRRGSSTSCGCARKELHRAALIARRNPYANERRLWRGMIARCTDPRMKCYRDYGGRGIHVDREWLDSFETFIRDMGPRPSMDHSIDRIDNDGPYAAWNCRWATRREQSLNRSNTFFVTAFGETKTAKDWVEDPRCKVSYTLLFFRLTRGRSGYTPESAITTPPIVRTPFVSSPSDPVAHRLERLARQRISQLKGIAKRRAAEACK